MKHLFADPDQIERENKFIGQRKTIERFSMTGKNPLFWIKYDLL